MHGDGLDLGIGACPVRAGQHLVVRLAHLLLVGQVQLDPADVRLVRDLWGNHFQHDRIADLAGQRQHLVERMACAASDHRDAIGGQQRFGLRLVEDLAVGLEQLLELGVPLPRMRVEVERHLAGRLVEQLLIPSIADQVHESLDGIVGGGRRRHAGLVEHVDAVADHAAAHPVGQYRLVGLACHAHQRLGGGSRIGHSLRGEDRQHRVDPFVVGDDLQGLGVALGTGVAQDVHRIAVRPRRRQYVAESLYGRRGKLRQLSVECQQSVAGDHARSARVGDHRQTVAAHARAPGQQLRAVEQVVDLENADDAGPLERGFVYAVDAGHGTGVRSRRLSRFGETFLPYRPRWA